MSQQNETKLTPTNILNRSYDPTLDILLVEPVETSPDGTSGLRKVTGNLATVIRSSGNYIYIGKAAIGTATSAASWQVKRLDTTTLLDITWADGNASYDNVFDNYASLSYS